MTKELKIGFFGTKPEEEKYLRGKLIEAKVAGDFFFTPETISPDHKPAQNDFDIISTFVDSQIDKGMINEMPNLSHIAVRSTGYDNIDLAATKARGIAVSNVPSYGENTVAEFTFGLILNLSRKIGEAYDQVRDTGSFKLENLRGFDLSGKTLGVIGTGRIGRNVIQIAKGFDLNVLAFDMYPNKDLEKQFGFSYAPLAEVLAKSDIVTLHVPYMKETHHLMDAKAFSQMKKGSYLVNTSRGAVVDTMALVDALKKKHLAGAGLDVLEEEGVIKDELDFISKGHPAEHDLKTILADHALIDMPNVIVTPHNAFNTKEALNRILDTTVSNIAAFIAGKPENLVK